MKITKTSVCGIGFIIIILVSHNLPGAYDAGSVAVVTPTERSESRAAKCARLHPAVPDRYWDDELEVYLPPNYGWWECMGVGVR